ncbi:MAG: hypothetical protein JW939_05165 [Candidatus Thermoplasmatota archaeon]|nr:hypothetical protein [Candidatus Thermoplasmatota archaeon]
MRNDLGPVVTMTPIAMTLIALLLFCGAAEGAAVMVDGSMITYSPQEPQHSDTFNVTVEPVLIDAEPVEDGVVLMWSLCTEDGCGIAQPEVMTDNGDGTWSVAIGPFDVKDPVSGKDYLDILFRVKVTAVPTVGGDEIMKESDPLTVYFKEGPSVDDDDDVSDDDSDDSPFGLEFILICMLLTAGYAGYKRKY